MSLLILCTLVERTQERCASHLSWIMSNGLFEGVRRFALDAVLSAPKGSSRTNIFCARDDHLYQTVSSSVRTNCGTMEFAKESRGV